MMCRMFFLYISLLLCCSARDTLRVGEWISNGESLVSDGGSFELGFFTRSGKTYLGIWYEWDKHTVAWVANRDDPLIDSNVTFGISESYGVAGLKVLDAMGKDYLWSTPSYLCGSYCTNQIVKLMDSGNLVVTTADSAEAILWNSFEKPTDTFLPGMTMVGQLELKSWRGLDDPGSGSFKLKLISTDADDYGNQYQQFSILSTATTKIYWSTDFTGKFFRSDEMPYNVRALLVNNTAGYSDYDKSNLVMGINGRIEHRRWDTETKTWVLMWESGHDKCSLYNSCGDFGICNRNNALKCKCLPGFKPNVLDKWHSGDYSDGCTKITKSSCDKNEVTFLNLTMMMGKNPDLDLISKNEMDCKKECLNNCKCKAYSYEPYNAANIEDNCWIWTKELVNLQEEYGYEHGGRNLSVRVAISDIESTRRDREPCGTNMIPYPLSTAPNCGDPMYFSFDCNTLSGVVSFQSPSGTYRVTSIDTKKFVIKDAGNFTKKLHLNQSLPFIANLTRNYTSKVIDEVEISWKLTQEPTCNLSIDCKDWPHSTCHAIGDGNRRCHCSKNFQWDGLKLNCTERHHSQQLKKTLPLVVGVTLMVIVLSCTMTSIYIRRRKRKESITTNQRNRAFRMLDNERHVKDLIDLDEFKEEDEKGIDVPFFDLESMLAATGNFSDANKLGQGGYGPVYKGKFPGGQEIAAKRLSTVSGQGLQEFKNEVVLIAKLQHRNLVRLLGYCIKGDEKILIYEYMPNKSLDSFIFDKSLSMVLGWEMRFNIILGIARGLLYLHQDSRLRIIHRYLKTNNILLDESMNPKISNFGLAKIVGGKQTKGNTGRIAGTYGYMSPEYALEGIFSIKSDVFSFGVVLLEILSGKKNTGFYQPKQPMSLLGYAWSLWIEKKVLDLMDETLQATCNANQFVKCVNVGLLCVQEDPSDRPTMSNVINMLESETSNLPTPTRPAFVLRRDRSNTASSSSSRPDLTNELTNSLQEGR